MSLEDMKPFGLTQGGETMQQALPLSTGALNLREIVWKAVNLSFAVHFPLFSLLCFQTHPLQVMWYLQEQLHCIYMH